MKWIKSKKTKRLEWIEDYLNKKGHEDMFGGYHDSRYHIDQRFKFSTLGINANSDDIKMILEHLGLEIKTTKSRRKIRKKK